MEDASEIITRPKAVDTKPKKDKKKDKKKRKLKKKRTEAHHRANRSIDRYCGL